MKNVLKEFSVITLAFVIMLALVFKPYNSEVVDLHNFTEYYSDNSSIEEGGGIELEKNNFYTIERVYSKEEKIEEKLAKTDEKESITVGKEKTDKIKKEDKKEKTEKKEEIKLDTYIVKRGDTLGGIASKYGMRVDILKANNPEITTNLKVGQKIKVVKGGNGIFYKIKKGDSLFKIALNYKVDVNKLKKDNNIRGNNIKVGDEIFISNPSEETIKRIEVKKISKSKRNKVTNSGFMMPIRWTGITSPYGRRFHPVLKRYIFHAGVDMKARYIPLKASKDGIVIFAGYMNGYGKIIKISHGNGYETRSAHLDKIYVKRGQRVKAGDIIGKTGMSGRVTGPHLHFEIRKNGKVCNPMNYLKR